MAGIEPEPPASDEWSATSSEVRERTHARLVADEPAFEHPFSAEALECVKIRMGPIGTIVVCDLLAGRFADARKWARVGLRGCQRTIEDAEAYGGDAVWLPKASPDHVDAGEYFEGARSSFASFAYLALPPDRRAPTVPTLQRIVKLQAAQAPALLDRIPARAGDFRFIALVANQAMQAIYLHWLYPAAAMGLQELASQGEALHRRFLGMTELLPTSPEQSVPPCLGPAMIEAYEAFLQGDATTVIARLREAWRWPLRAYPEDTTGTILDLLPFTVRALAGSPAGSGSSIHPGLARFDEGAYWGAK
jgi:hypothetical protein